jgi:hypothetical protein
MYYWKSSSSALQSRPALLNDMLLMRHCLVDALDGQPGVRLFAFDDVPGLASDMRNYFDPAHLYNAAANRYVLQSIAADQHRLTRSNIDAKNAEMHSAVAGYEFTNTTEWLPP